MSRGLLTMLLLAVAAGSARASGFGVFHRPAEVRLPVYSTPTVLYYPLTPAVPVICLPPVPVVTAPPPAYPVAVPQPAAPRPAPPSETPEPPDAGPRPSAALRTGESYYDLLPGPPGMTRAGEEDRCSVRFWNLTRDTFTLRVAGETRPLPPGRSTTVVVPMTFAWQIEGREGEATRVPQGLATAEILIRK